MSVRVQRSATGTFALMSDDYPDVPDTKPGEPGWTFYTISATGVLRVLRRTGSDGAWIELTAYAPRAWSRVEQLTHP